MKIQTILITLILSINVTAKVNKNISLTDTYQKELAFLLAQKKSLLSQIKNLDKQYQGKISKASKLIKTNEDKLIMLSADNERLVSNLNDIERSLEDSQNNNSLVETTINQAKLTVGLSDDDLSKFAKNEEKLDAIFDKAFSNLEMAQKRTLTDGTYFLSNGTKVKGKMLHFGSIATFGELNGKMSMLMPVGGGDFKFLETATNNLQVLSESKMPEVLTAFIYESKDKAIEPKKEQTFMEMVHAGGMIAYVIVGLGLFAFVLIAIRGFLLWKTGKVNKEIIADIESNNITNLPNKLASDTTSLSRVLTKTYMAKDLSVEERDNVINESILGELNFLDKFGAVILVMAAVAPLLGLLGTVTGMISTFDIITEFGTGDPKLLSSGISEALITTKLGLVVAIPTLLVGNLFGGWSTKIKVMLEREALRLSNIENKVANA